MREHERQSEGERERGRCRGGLLRIGSTPSHSTHAVNTQAQHVDLVGIPFFFFYIQTRVVIFFPRSQELLRLSQTRGVVRNDLETS